MHISYLKNGKFAMRDIGESRNYRKLAVVQGSMEYMIHLVSITFNDLSGKLLRLNECQSSSPIED